MTWFLIFICCFYNPNNLLCLVDWLAAVSLIYLISKSQFFFLFFQTKNAKKKNSLFPFLNISLMFVPLTFADLHLLTKTQTFVVFHSVASWIIFWNISLTPSLCLLLLRHMLPSIKRLSCFSLHESKWEYFVSEFTHFYGGE